MLSSLVATWTVHTTKIFLEWHGPHTVPVVDKSQKVPPWTPNWRRYLPFLLALDEAESEGEMSEDPSHCNLLMRAWLSATSKLSFSTLLSASGSELGKGADVWGGLKEQNNPTLKCHSCSLAEAFKLWLAQKQTRHCHKTNSSLLFSTPFDGLPYQRKMHFKPRSQDPLYKCLTLGHPVIC